jgi:hypothetical protein
LGSRSRVAIFCALIVAWISSGCEADRGYVSVKTSYAIRPGDTYWLGEQQLSPAPGGEIDAVLGAEVGPRDIYIRRGYSKIEICSVTVSKDRIVTVTIDRGPSGGLCNVIV